jgi:TIR domain
MCWHPGDTGIRGYQVEEPRIADTVPSRPYLFVSYASRDRDRVLRIVQQLEVAGIPVWIDREGIPAGANYGVENAASDDAAAEIMRSDPVIVKGVMTATRSRKRRGFASPTIPMTGRLLRPPSRSASGSRRGGRIPYGRIWHTWMPTQ